MKTVYLCIVNLLMVSLAAADSNVDVIKEPYNLDTGLVSRSISFENPTGQPGKGGTAAHSLLGIGRKGKPFCSVKPGQTVQLCDINGPGMIRHIWITTHSIHTNLRSMVIRGWYDGQSHPSIECPLGDFMGFAHGVPTGYSSAVHSVGPKAGMNIWLPMPFVKNMKMTITNDGNSPYTVYYQIDYTLGDKLPKDVGRLHVLFRRENPTTLKHDFEILPQRNNKGRYIGAVLGVRNRLDLHPKQWWGEGEFKVYMDGDSNFPTICGTGSEDYVGLSWGMQQCQFPYNGCNLFDKDKGYASYVSMYRWHLPDPISWQKQCRITIQQIAHREHALWETQDDWSAATFWYEPLPSAPLPPMPDVKGRTADLPPMPEAQK